MLGFWRITAENQKMTYMETMFNDPAASDHAKKISEELSDTVNITNRDDFGKAYEFVKNQIDEKGIAEESTKNVEEFNEDATEFCSIKIGHSCEIPFQFIHQVHRTRGLNEVFTEMVVGFEIANKSDLVTAINMVGKEDNSTALQDYIIHMQMLEFLKKKYPDVNISLHAGELWTTLEMVPPSDLTFHVNKAITVGKAQRIGHAVDIRNETSSNSTLLPKMQKIPIAVEVPLTSNFVILNVSVADHPFRYFLEKDVPVVLSTDDPGILRTNMTNEYAKAAYLYQDLNYSDFKKIVRNSLEYSFLPGKSLWIDPGTYKETLDMCVFPNLVDCWDPEHDKKALMQLELEGLLDDFEENYPK